MTYPKLSYVALISRDIPAASRLLGDVLGLPRTRRVGRRADR